MSDTYIDPAHNTDPIGDPLADDQSTLADDEEQVQSALVEDDESDIDDEIPMLGDDGEVPSSGDDEKF